MGDDDSTPSVIYTQFIPVKPKVKGRPRMGRRGAYTPRATKDYEDAIREHYDGPEFDGPVRVHMDFHPNGTYIVIEACPEARPKGVTGDIDNYQKAILDGLQSVAVKDATAGVPGAWANDRMIHATTASFSKSEFLSPVIEEAA